MMKSARRFCESFNFSTWARTGQERKLANCQQVGRNGKHATGLQSLTKSVLEKSSRRNLEGARLVFIGY